MRRLVGWLLAGLPFDARSRRAIDETLLDWEGEATALRQAQGREARRLEATFVELRGVASVLRVTSLSMLRESIDFSWVRGLGRRFAVAAAVVMVVTLYDGWFRARPDRADWIAISLTLVPFTLVQVTPVTLFLAFAWRRREGRTGIGAIALAASVTFVLIHWVLPLSNQAFRELVAGRSLTPGRGPVLLTSVGWASYCAAIVALANVTGKAGFMRSWWWLPAGFVAMHLTLMGALQGTRSVLLALGGDGLLRPGLATLTLAAVLASLAVALERRLTNASCGKLRVEAGP